MFDKLVSLSLTSGFAQREVNDKLTSLFHCCWIELPQSLTQSALDCTLRADILRRLSIMPANNGRTTLATRAIRFRGAGRRSSPIAIGLSEPRPFRY